MTGTQQVKRRRMTTTRNKTEKRRNPQTVGVLPQDVESTYQTLRETYA
jgi:hypothetical protein